MMDGVPTWRDPGSTKVVPNCISRMATTAEFWLRASSVLFLLPKWLCV